MNIAKRDHTLKHSFLGGSIEMGKAVDWQKDMTVFFNELGIGVFNPRRDDWNSDWKQDFTNPQFSQQVNWELNALKYSDIIIMNFVSDTISPISLMELGLYANSGKIYVISPSTYYRNGNVEIVCNTYNIPLFDVLEEFQNYFIKIGLSK